MPKRDRSVMEQAFQEIRRRIITLQVEPGQRLDDVALAKDLALSRTPVREALFRLGAEGLVTPGERGGFTVRPLDLFDISQLFEAHIVVARAVARLAATRATDTEIDHLAELTDAVEDAVRAGDPAGIAATNAELHRAEARCARNEHLRVLANNVQNLGQRLSYLCFGGDRGGVLDLDDHLERVCTDHTAMIEALRTRDVDEAERVAARHVHLFRDRVVEFFEATPVESLGFDQDLPPA
ncbi:GntR family transcriptional regulator [Pseudonocardia halophobica]|uniref:GntR family transcriptional regulator n=1 Tax=Pseudonocardia halophobica TaxID=29401 RepID=A0A9W6NUQ9_9PSEU|nr:GntR family transcriptional regulator [Pseudonocardia halophobica]GLL09701.1 GntR family transcriptional regulator [Pseudonocardia halophobica]